MTATAALRQTSLTAEPGETTTVDLTVRNRGRRVDQFHVEVLGPSAEWSAVTPATLSLTPGAEDTVTITISPPRLPSTPLGQVPFGARVVATEDPASSTVEEATLHVGAFFDVAAELVPRMSHGRRRVRHELTVHNNGNAPVEASVEGLDPDEALDFDCKPGTVRVDPGGAQLVRVRVRPRERLWRGTPRTRSFRVLVNAASGPLVGVDGTFLQEPLIPSWLPRALAGLVALAMLAATLATMLWTTLVRPAVQDAAAQAVTPGLDEQQQELDNQQQELDDLEAAIIDIDPKLLPDADARDTTRPFGDPVGGRLDVTADIDGSQEVASAPVPADATLHVTDIVVENPGPAVGDVVVLRAGEVVLRLRLENFRTFDYHFVAPITVTSEQTLTLRVACEESETGACPVGLYYSGFQEGAPDAES